MKTLQITLPYDIVNTVEFYVKQDESFFLEAIKEKIAAKKNDNLEAILKEGYQATSEEDINLTREFDFKYRKNLSV